MNISEVKGQIFNIENYAIHDGQGIRTLVFFKGCPMRCQWCANPEGLTTQPELVFYDHLCIACGSCIDTCPNNALSFRNKYIQIDRDRCNTCGICVENCHAEALRLNCREMTVKEVMDEIEKNIVFFKNSNGGVTLSGGEALMQLDFATEVLKNCKRKGLSTAIETCGFYAFDVLKKVIDNLDYIFYDIKHMDNEKHRQFTGVGNKIILDNLLRLQNYQVNINVRIPVLPGINDDIKNITATAKMIATLPKVKFIELLPYHRFGIHKYNELDRAYTLNEMMPPDKKDLYRLKKIFDNFHLNCKIG